MLHETPSVQLSRLLDGEDEEAPDDYMTPPAQAFRRAQSRVYHASEWVEQQECCWGQAAPKPDLGKRSPVEQQEWQLVVSGNAGPPSHRSQDSGFSDSESEASPQLEFKPLPRPAVSPTPGAPIQCSTPKAARTTTLRARIVNKKSSAVSTAAAAAAAAAAVVPAAKEKKDSEVHYGRTVVGSSLDLLLTTR
jgi:hypothetical protein